MILQTYKSSGADDRARAWYDHHSKVDGDFLIMRDIVQAKKKPRRLDVYSNFYKYGESIEPVHYAENLQGVIHSYVDRYPFNNDLYEQVMSQWMPEAESLRVAKE